MGEKHCAYEQVLRGTVDKVASFLIFVIYVFEVLGHVRQGIGKLFYQPLECFIYPTVAIKDLEQELVYPADQLCCCPGFLSVK